ncbi:MULTISPECIES: type VII secretion system-associated protein [unclassified Streptomyces]|uniref:type VII secretion system-associated protein n=1 Tax=unclassified Streptomyces TaxID=2593676 RepID=UPI0022564782|nr:MULTISPECIES: type VII secretion system-associated protein [unclassified Streptomyces]MCX4406012.1 type VII secretion system-associated protein [Streptomyces sp. NBC_01764]MCX5189464.1 type VII secretion system-associated protein [Streptomyces sp. NBC_00268]
MNIDTPSRSAVDAGPETGPGTHTPDDPTDESGYATEQQSDEGEPGGFRRSFAPPPQPTEELRQAAALAPDHWLGMVDPAWQGDGPPPAWALIGRWRSGPTGKIEEWQDNSDYRPSPEALGWPEPTDDVDAAVQLASTGYGSADDVPRTLAGAEVAVLISHDGIPLTATAPDGTPVLPVYTSLTHVHAAGRLAYDLVTVADLVERLPEEHLLYLNPTGAVSMLVETEPLLEALAALEQAAAEPETSQENTAADAPDGAGVPVGASADSPDDASGQATAEDPDHAPRTTHRGTTGAPETADAPEADPLHPIPGMEPESHVTR